MKTKFLFLFLLASVFGWGQVTLPTTSPYSQNFNTTPGASGTSYPTGWTSYNNTNIDNDMIVGNSTSSGGANYNYVNRIGLLGSNSAFSPGSIVLSITSTSGKESFKISYDVIKIREQTRNNSFNLEVSTTSATSGFSPISGGTYSSGTIAEGTTTSYSNLDLSSIDDHSGTIWLRWYYSDIGGSSSRDGIALDNVSISWTDILVGPTITVSDPTTTLNLGTNICQGTHSATGSYTVSGSNLTGNIELTPAPTLQISTDNSTWYSSTSNPKLSLTPNGSGTVSNTTIYVRSMNNLPIGTFPGTISHTSSGATTVTKNVSGTVVFASIATNPATPVANTTATLHGSYSNPGNCFTATEKGFIYSSDNPNPLNGDVNGTTVVKVPATDVATGIYNSPITGLSTSTEYSFRSYVTNGTDYLYGEVRTFTTLGVATNLAFNNLPATGAVGANLTSFTVEARRAGGSVDTEYTGAVTLSKASGPGNMTGTLTVNAVAGIATFNNISFDDAGTYTIQAASGSLPSITSGNIVMSYVSSASDYFRSRQTGNPGDWNAVASWDSSADGVNWIDATLVPTSSANTITIQTGHTINVTSNVTADQIVVETGGILSVNNNSLTLNNGTGTDLTVNGTLNLSGNSGAINRGSSTIVFGANSFYNHNRNGGVIPTATWDLTSTCSINGVTSTNPSYASFSQNFGNFVWNSNQTAFINLDSNAIGFSTQGLFTVANTGFTYNFCLSQNSGSNVTYNFGAIRVLNNASLQLTHRNSTNAGIVTVNVAGDVGIENSGTIEFGGGTSDANSGDYRSIMNIGGDLSVSSAGYLWLSGENLSYGKIVFNKNGTQNYTNLSQNTFSIVHEITNSSTLNILSNIRLDDYNGFDVFGTINLRNHEIIGNDYDDFKLHDDATLITSHPEGISALGTNLGAIQVGYERDYSLDGTYIYNGTTNQNTGNGLPEIVQSIIIENTGTTGNNEVTLTNGELGVSDNLIVNSGIFNLNGLEVYGGGVPSSELRIAENAELKIGGTQSFPEEFGTITFAPLSNVHYAGANQTIATSDITSYSNLSAYENLTISGTGIKTSGGKDLMVNNITTVASSELRIPETTTNSETPYALTSKKGIQVGPGATALFENNANLMQDAGAVNTGDITQLRDANVPSNQYNYWTYPVKDQQLYTLYGEDIDVPANKVMRYNPQNDYFIVIQDTPTALSAFGKGYSVRGPASNPSGNVTAKFVGEPNNQTSIALGNQIAVETFDSGNNYNLIGNPFPSNLDLTKMFDETDLLNTGNAVKFKTSTAYFWDNVSNTETTQQGSGYQQSNYATLNMASGTGTEAPCTTCFGGTSGGSGKKPNGIVKPGQGFIVNINEGSTFLTVNNEMRTTAIRQSGDSEDAVYYKNGNIGAVDDIYGSRPRNNKFWVELINPNGLKIQIAVGYFERADNNFEIYDSKIMSANVSDNLYSLSQDAVKLTIQGRQAPFENTDVIPLGVKFFAEGKYKIQLEETLGIFKAHQTIYLKDKYLNQIHNLSESFYDFEGTPGVFEDRFEIVFKDGNQTNDPVLSTASDNYVKIIKKDNQIEISSSKDKILEVEIFNLSGWSIYKNEKVNSKTLNVSAPLLGKQIVVVKVQTETGEIITKKIINK